MPKAKGIGLSTAPMGDIYYCLTERYKKDFCFIILILENVISEIRVRLVP